MPLWKLQTIGGASYPFLYQSTERASEIEIRAGIAFFLRSYHPLIVELVRGAWVRYVRRHNAQLLGEEADLYQFLFGHERDPGLMSRCGPILHEVQDGLCLYCEKSVRTNGQVDHFIPWALYPIDLGHNLVFAHARCNQKKSDRLAAEHHLAAWLARSRERGHHFEAEFDRREILHDRVASERVAHWAYAQVATSSARVWRDSDRLEPLSGRWSNLLS